MRKMGSAQISGYMVESWLMLGRETTNETVKRTYASVGKKDSKNKLQTVLLMDNLCI